MSGPELPCGHFDHWLDVLIEGRHGPDGPPPEGHLATCPRCRRAVALARGEIDLLEPAEHDSLVQAVLRRTSGSPCARARLALCDRIDGALVGPARDLVDHHLEFCPDCRETAATLLALGAEVRPLAEIDPGPAFTSEVLRAARAGRPARPEWAGALRSLARRLVARPRLAWEVACALTLVLVALAGVPSVPQVDAAPRVLHSVRPRVQSLAALAPDFGAARTRAAVVVRAPAAALGAARERVSSLAARFSPGALRRVALRLWRFFIDADRNSTGAADRT